VGNTSESPQHKKEDRTGRGLIHNRRDAIVASVLTLVVLGSTLRSMMMRPPHDPWFFARQSGLPVPLLIGLSLFFWAFVCWILFWFYRAARDKYERLLVGGFAIGFLLSIFERFVPSTRIGLEPASATAFLASFAAALTLLVKLTSTRSRQQM
jgi:hypothetical protein